MQLVSETLLTRSVALVATVLRSAADEALPDRDSIEPGDGRDGFEEVLVGLGQRLPDADGLTWPGRPRALATLATRWSSDGPR